MHPTATAAQPPSLRSYWFLQEFMKQLESDFKSNKKVSDYARQLFVSPGYLNCNIKKVTGFPAKHHIQQRIIREAKAIALQRNISMKQIAYELGFEDVAHFSKFFKTITGNNFSHFKKCQAISCFELRVVSPLHS